ncbi:MAG TPA: hypothetical protein VFL70_09420, partial [Bacteroidia bacterium]|nr:hypothetical protein [Bacteroidia bacterium]
MNDIKKYIVGFLAAILLTFTFLPSSIALYFKIQQSNVSLLNLKTDFEENSKSSTEESNSAKPIQVRVIEEVEHGLISLFAISFTQIGRDYNFLTINSKLCACFRQIFSPP